MKIYSHKTNSTYTDFGAIFQIAVVVAFLIILSVVSHAEPIYECDITLTSECVVHMEEILPADAELKDALALCEYFDGIYEPENDTCTIDKGVHHE